MASNHSELIADLVMYGGHPRRTAAEKRVATMALTDVCGAFSESQQTLEQHERNTLSAISDLNNCIGKLESHRRVRQLLHEATVRALGAPQQAKADDLEAAAEPLIRRAMHLAGQKVDA